MNFYSVKNKLVYHRTHVKSALFPLDSCTFESIKLPLLKVMCVRSQKATSALNQICSGITE